MYISELKLWNFRKYGNDQWDLEKPHLTVPFTPGTNVLIGENDSGKTAIIDAIKLVLKTHAYEWIKVEKEDFHRGSDKLRIEIILEGLVDEEAKNFTEWLGWKGKGEDAKPMLRLILSVERNSNRILPYEVKAGMNDFGHTLNAEARYYLKSTYLKALRDADDELIAKKNSRLSQILQGHDLFMKTEGVEHEFETWFSETNEKVKTWFNNTDKDDGQKSIQEQIKSIVDQFLKAFIDDSVNSEMKLTEPEIKTILEKISLGIEGAKNLGLGTMNRLYMAIELLHLKKEWNGLKLGLIEELEAHLHPQAQMKVIEALQQEEDVQFILTTHSPNLASKVNITNLILCESKDVFSLSADKTKLDKKDYKYLKRFLDVTKSNLFFAKGIIIVEGWSEEILIPEIARNLGYDLTKKEVSIVNVGSTAYLHFARIFLRKDDKKLNIPVSVVTDLDVKPKKDIGIFDEAEQRNKEQKIRSAIGDISGSNVILEIAKEWTLEWCLYKSDSLSELFKESVSKVHSKTKSFKKNEESDWNPNFERTLISKLKKGKGDSPLNKVAIANELAEKISQDPNLVIAQDDEYIEYLIKAIRHACRIE
jgi:putative ATP-dependent endonuclease of OLD family